MEIQYITGDGTRPHVEGNAIIAHICNDIGGWGKGFVLALSKRWQEPERQYRQWHQSGENFALGEIQVVDVEPHLAVANMIGQHDIRRKGVDAPPPIRYDAVASCLEKLAAAAAERQASVHMPRIGCGLAGGKWERIEPLIRGALTDKGVAVYVYDFA